MLKIYQRTKVGLVGNYIFINIKTANRNHDMKNLKRHFINLIFPAFIFGAITGIFTALIVILYKLIAKYVIAFSQNSYVFLREKLYLIPLVLIAFFGIALLFSRIYKKEPRMQGGGIPSSIALLRGIVTFKWLRTLIGVFFMSMTSFLIGVPLGNEGPSVLMGTAVGKGSVKLFAKKHPAWSRYSMTGGACAGFSVATGASISGVLFAVEEGHQRISPMILLVGAISVLFAQVVSEILCPVLGLSTSIFPKLNLVDLTVKDAWLPLLVGGLVGLFAVLFLKYYHVVNDFFNLKIKKISLTIKIFLVFVLTLGFGLISFSFVSTGHEIFSLLLEDNLMIFGLIILLLVRMTLTLFANTNKLTGGVFVPILALGAILSSIIANGMETLFGLSYQYYVVIIVLGISSCISAMMKMPLTAMIFSIEALGCANNIIHVIIAVAISFVITEIFKAKGINDGIIKNLIKRQEETHQRQIIDTYVVIKKGSFAENMQAKDILWPANFFLLSIIPSKTRQVQIDQQGDKSFHEGDVLHIRYATFDESHTKQELIAIVGEQDYDDESIVFE